MPVRQKPTKFVERSFELRGFFVCDGARRDGDMTRWQAGIARGTLDCGPRGLVRFFPVGTIADDRTEAGIGESLYVGRIDLRRDRKTIRQALGLCHEVTFRSLVNF